MNNGFVMCWVRLVLCLFDEDLSCYSIRSVCGSKINLCIVKVRRGTSRDFMDMPANKINTRSSKKTNRNYKQIKVIT